MPYVTKTPFFIAAMLNIPCPAKMVHNRSPRVCRLLVPPASPTFCLFAVGVRASDISFSAKTRVALPLVPTPCALGPKASFAKMRESGVDAPTGGPSFSKGVAFRSLPKCCFLFHLLISLTADWSDCMKSPLNLNEFRKFRCRYRSWAPAGVLFGRQSPRLPQI